VTGGVVDLVLLLVLVLFAISGYRQGFVVGVLSLLGFFGGALIGLQIGPVIAHVSSDPGVRVFIAILVVFGLAGGGQILAAWLGSRMRRGIRSPGGQRLDDAGGAIVSLFTAAFVLWLVAVPLGSSSVPDLARAVRTSGVLRTIDRLMPHQARVLSDALRSTVNTGDFPDVFGDLVPTDVPNVPPPDPALAKSAVVTNAHKAVVKILGSAPSCSRRLEGSGFVYAPQHVMTNAHVLAGVRSVVVEANGDRRNARVVLYDPQRDLAVLYVPGLDVTPLRFATQPAGGGDNAIVLGYPLDGPYTARAARIRDVRDIRGPNIYNDRTVVREIYTIRSDVRSGNSGGPLITLDGTVLGVVFAAAVDDPSTGFVLTANEASPVAASGASRTDSTGTGSCV
jgi:S1-C subfamily serine protease